MGREFEEAVRNARFSADSVAMADHPTPAKKTEAIVRRTLEALLANGIIEIKPIDEWPPFYSIDPPYELPKQRGSE